MFHTPNINLTKFQSKVLGIPLISLSSLGIKEKELNDLRKAITIAKKKYKIEAVVSGAIASNYQKERIEKICQSLKLKSITPLWNINPEKYLLELISNNFDIIFTSVSADGFDKSWLGRKLNQETLEDLKKLHIKNNLNISLDGGEAETLVLDCPIYKKKLIIEKSEKIMESECTGKLIIKKIRLKKK